MTGFLVNSKAFMNATRSEAFTQRAIHGGCTFERSHWTRSDGNWLADGSKLESAMTQFLICQVVSCLVAKGKRLKKARRKSSWSSSIVIGQTSHLAGGARC